MRAKIVAKVLAVVFCGSGLMACQAEVVAQPTEECRTVEVHIGTTSMLASRAAATRAAGRTVGNASAGRDSTAAGSSNSPAAAGILASRVVSGDDVVSYLVLARKYRPQTFEDLIGQDHVARTLANAIATGRVAHAFLFTGVRGVGKTTSARLLAKCLSCVGPDGKAPGPTATPCNQCAPCLEITGGRDLDVQEIDGASYNGVDEVRRLQEGMTFRPARDRFKIYIVDEVHMLSTAAWNAFLKTLEEPPPHVKFIFATTEASKVPVTILSRCQRYDFKLIATQAIAGRLDQVLAQESIEADPVAVQILAREAAGSMRDAMSLLDQVIAYSGTKLSGDDVARVLGVADRNILHELATALVDGNAAACLGVIDRLAQQGFDLTHVTKDVLRHLRNLVVAKVCAGQAAAHGPSLRELLDLADEESRDVLDLAGRAEADDLSRLFQGFSRAFDDVVRSAQPRMALEMALVRLARRPPLLPLDELLSRVGELERRLGGAPPPAPAPRGGGGGGGGRAQTSHDSGMAPAAAPIPTSTRTHGALALADPRKAPSSEPRRVPSPPAVAIAPPVATVPPARAPTPAAAAASPAPDLAVWRAILDCVRARRPALASVLDHALPLETTAARFVVGFEPGAAFLGARASEPDALEELTRAVRAHFGAPTSVALDLSARAAAGTKTIASLDSEKHAAELARARAAVEGHPLVLEAVRLFGAQLRDVKLPASEG
jgi:DNA polymerase-3 subunit gamma/tau